MKKILLLMVITITAVQLLAQQIIVDKVEDNGNRIIATQIAYSGYRGLYLGMSSVHLKEGGDTTLFIVNIRYGSYSKGRTIAKGRKLLLKLSDNSVITLENSEEIGPADYEWEVINNGTYNEQTIYYVYPKYYITKEQLSKICNNEVIKIRLEYDSGEYTIEETKRKKNKFSTIIRYVYSQIQDAYKTEKDIYTDF